MPAAKLCGHPGCPNPTPCAEHRKIPWAGSHRRKQLPPGWSSRIVPRILRRDVTCQLAITCGGMALATEVHHVGDPMNHSDENLAGVCRRCHNVATQAQAHS